MIFLLDLTSFNGAAGSCNVLENECLHGSGPVSGAGPLQVSYTAAGTADGERQPDCVDDFSLRDSDSRHRL